MSGGVSIIQKYTSRGLAMKIGKVLYEKSKAIVLTTKSHSISHLQRHLGVGYSTAVVLMELVKVYEKRRAFFLRGKKVKTLHQKCTCVTKCRNMSR